MYDFFLQILAFFLLLIPYIMVTTGKWKGNSYKFLVLNVIGGFFMVSVFTLRKDFILLLLNLIWTIGGLIQIVKKYRGLKR